MPSPDVSYVLCSSLECGHLAPDAYFFLNACADADAILDAYRTPDGLTHWDGLIDMSLYLESSYVNRGIDIAASIMALGHSMATLTEVSRNAVSRSSQHATTVWKRSVRRSVGKLSGLSEDDMREALDEHHRSRRIAYDLRDELYLEESEKKRALENMKARRAIKRSAKLLSKIVGDEQVRLFVGGHFLKISGRLADYEISSGGASLSHAHGGHQAFRVLDKDTGIIIATGCIVTSDVPMMDHVASLILHIQAGEEELVLEKANLSVVQKIPEEHVISRYLPAPAMKFPPLEAYVPPAIDRKIISRIYRDVVYPYREIISVAERIYTEAGPI